MVKLQSALLVTVLLSGACGASRKSPDAPPPSKPSSTIGMWELRVDGAAPSYLLGTCHIGVRLEEAVPSRYLKYLENADQVVSEANINLPQKEAMRLFFEMTLPADQSLKALLGEPDWTTLIRSWRSFPPLVIDRMVPFLAGFILMGAEAQPDGEAAIEPMDMLLSKEAQKRQIPAIYLETLDQQIALLKSESLDQQVESLKSMMNDLRQIDRPMDGILQACMPDGIQKVGLEGLRTNTEFDKSLFDQRNRNWAPTLEKIVREGNAFIFVGLGHMLGEVGLLQLLEAQGIKATQLTVSAEEAEQMRSRMANANSQNPPTVSEAPAAAPQDSLVAKWLNGPRNQVFQSLIAQSLDAACREDQVFLKCYDATQAQCRERFREDLETCIYQHDPYILEKVDPKSTAVAAEIIGRCAGASYLLRARIGGWYRASVEACRNPAFD